MTYNAAPTIREYLIDAGYKVDSFSLSLLAELSKTLCPNDRYELAQTNFNCWERELKETLQAADCVFCVSNQFVAGDLVFGVTKFTNDVGRVWLVRTSDFSLDGVGQRISFFREARKILSMLQCEYGTLFNIVPKRSTYTIKWLEALGFHLYPDLGIGAQSLLFSTGPNKFTTLDELQLLQLENQRTHIGSGQFHVCERPIRRHTPHCNI